MYQVKKKQGKLKLPSTTGQAVTRTEQSGQTQQQNVNNSQQSQQKQAPAEESQNPNAVYGIYSATETEKNKTMTTDEYLNKLKRGELLFGPVPATPTIPAIDAIFYDYCDGIRVLVTKKKEESDPVTTYHILIKDHITQTVICNGLVDNADNRFVTSQQKYFVHLDLTIVRRWPLPNELKQNIIQHYKLTDVELDMIWELAVIPEATQEGIQEEIFSKCFVLDENEKPRYAHAIDEVLTYYQKVHTFHHHFDPEGREVAVQFPISTIGDSIGWFSYLDRFQKKTKCKLLAVMNPAIYCLFEKQYPNIKFIHPKELSNYKPYASYNMGLFFKGDTLHQPYDFRYIGNGRTVSKILDVDDTDIAPKVDLSAPRKIKEPYVCIAVNGSAYCKLWSNPLGWKKVIAHLKEIGYRVICIDKDTMSGAGFAVTQIPWGVEDDTGNKPLQERIDILKDCDFFIGLSSGVSWLAWCAKCPVVLISGFTNPFNEYYTPYRVLNPYFCHGCWNDGYSDFDHYDYMWCPKHKGTLRAYECSKNIAPEHVLKVIEQIPAYQKMKAEYDKKPKKVNPYLAVEVPFETNEEVKPTEQPEKKETQETPKLNIS